MNNWQLYIAYGMKQACDGLSWYCGKGFKSFVDDGFGNLIEANEWLICNYINSGDLEC